MKHSFTTLVIALLILTVFSSACLSSQTDNENLAKSTPSLTSSNILSDTSTNKSTVDEDSDTDDDGLTLSQEQQFDTDPLNPDTDGDELSDGDEVFKYKTNPRVSDTDEDGLSDGDEVFNYGTNPLVSDSDGDGLSDGDEVQLYKTDPLNSDSDSDLLSDSEEIIAYSTDPSMWDTDDDGLSDYEEIKKYNTNPMAPDTDEDGILDYTELLWETNPLKNDTDKDGLSDGDEVNTYGTNPLLADTDGDYLNDTYEIKIGTDPLTNWKYEPISTDSIKSALSIYLRSTVVNVSMQFSRYNSTLDKAWETLRWINETIKYNDTKAEYVTYFADNWENLSEEERELYLNLTQLQAPNETLSKKSGICGDYALLTAALLLNENISPIYILSIDYWNQSVGHATVAIRISGEYFLLDQKLPIKPLGNYYWYSIYTRVGEIENVTVYKVWLDNSGEVALINWTWHAADLKRRTYLLSKDDLTYITSLTEKIFLQYYPQYTKDSRLENLARYDLIAIINHNTTSNSLLPYGFSKGWVLWGESLGLGFYYHPILAEKLVEEYWPGPVLENKKWREVLKQCNRYYMLFGTREGVVTITDHYGDSVQIPELVMVIEVAAT